MPGRVYPTVAEATEFHKQLIEEFGGTQGPRPSYPPANQSGYNLVIVFTMVSKLGANLDCWLTETMAVDMRLTAPIRAAGWGAKLQNELGQAF